MPDNALNILICMGSSCFSRGNNRNIEVLQQVASAASQDSSCTLSGHLCQDQCKDGPNIVINGCVYHQVDPVSLLALINHHRREKEGCVR